MQHKKTQTTTIVIGLIGVTVLLLACLAYAAWESEMFYRIENIEQFVDDWQSRQP